MHVSKFWRWYDFLSKEKKGKGPWKETWILYLIGYYVNSNMLGLSPVPFLTFYFLAEVHYLTMDDINRTECSFPWPSIGFWSNPRCCEGKNFVLKNSHWFQVALHWGLLTKQRHLFGYKNESIVFVGIGAWFCMTLFTALWCLVLFTSDKKGFKISGNGSESRNSCWNFIDWCSCWWCGGNGKCGCARFWI